MQLFTYFKTLVTAPKPKATPVALWVAGYFVFFFGIYACKELFASFAFLAGMITCYYFNSTPNMETVFPIGHKKKLAYRFLSNILMFLGILAIVIVFLAVIFLFVAICVSIAEGSFGWIASIAPTDEGFAVFGTVGVYGILFEIAYFIIMYSAGMITSFFKTRKMRNIWLACLCGGVVASFVLMSVPYILGGGTGLTSPLVNACYAAMSLPWLSIVFWFILAFGALGAAIYMGIKHYDPKKF